MLVCHVGDFSNEYLSAFLARRRVESTTGKGEFFEFMTSGISVHPRMTASQPESLSFWMTFIMLLLEGSVIFPVTNSLKIIELMFSWSFSSGTIISIFSFDEASL